MKISAYIEEKQPLLYRTFSHALKTSSLAHAYLLSGETGIPLKQAAIYLAKSILCNHPNPFADETCSICQRIDRDEYPDFVLLDGDEGSIKKESVTSTLINFQKSALEAKGIMVYVIHLAERMSTEAANSLLKFLEEPSDNTYAILTTNNESRILPTIVSRCQTAHLLLVPREEVIKDALAIGANQEDAEILSYFFNDGALVKEQAEKEEYRNALSAFKTTMDSLLESKERARYIMEKSIIPLVTTKEEARFYFDMLSLLFQDVLSAKKGGSIILSSYANIIEELAKSLPHVDSSLLSLLTLRGEIETNIHLGLLLVHLIDTITKE